MIAPLTQQQGIRLLSCKVDPPTGYGRILRDQKNGAVLRIVEEKDATPEQKEIQEINAAVYLFQSRLLKEKLTQLSNKNAQGEYYLTDIVHLARQGLAA